MNLKSGPTIFVVEDNLIYQQLIAKELESVSTDIHFYTTGETCLHELDKNPSVLVLDYNLDGKINGLDTLKAIRTSKPAIPAILFSNQLDLYSKENLVQYGSFDFLEKHEHSFSQLKQLVNQLLTIPSFA